MAIDFRTFPWEPSSRITEVLEWQTDIIQGVSGSEQRISVRRYPRQSFEVTCSFSSEYDQANAHLAIAAGQDQVWGFPCWHEVQYLSAPLTHGAISIPVNTTKADYRASDYAILWKSATDFEVVGTSEVASGYITLSTATTNDFPSGASIMPLRRSYISPSAKISDRQVNNGDVSVTFSCLDSAEIVSSPSSVQYLGSDVLTDNLLMQSSTRDRSIDRMLWTLDGGCGVWEIQSLGDYPQISTEYFFKAMSSEEAWLLRKWLHRRCGRLVPAWVPSRSDDLILVAPINPLSANITIKDIGLRDYWERLPGKQNVALIRDDGAMVCKQITSVNSGSVGEEVVSLTDVSGVSSIKTISFLSLQRLTADRVEISWERPGWAEVKASMVEVPA